jgi:glucuronoarabinoxylan endo-1,4-beta-xylanase
VTTTCGNGTPGANDIVVDLAKGEQVMDGFGVSNALQKSAISDAVADQIFDKTKGIGLSIFRLGINTGGDSSGSWSDAVKAAARGAVIWAAPWSPPANCKTNGSTKNGGHLKTECYESWANTLAGFVAKGKSHNVEIMGISVQNEADNVVPYDSCIYTAAEMIAFVKVLSPKLKALSPPVKLIAPESTRWERLWTGEWNYGNAILADKDAADMVDVLATHMYENQIAHAPPAGVTKPIWQTEMSGIEKYPEHGPSSDIANGIASAKWVHDGIAVGRASAWHWWWIHPAYANDNEGLYLKGGAITKRLFTFGNFTKFIRPGYQRVNITGTLPTDVLMTAYKNPADGTVVMVAINSNKTATPISIFIAGGAPCQITPWVTSATEDLKESTTKLSITDGKLTATLTAQSVTTFVGKP